MRFNKKLVYLSIFLIIILFLINGCKEYKGRFISSEDSSYGGCKENWQCSGWGPCINNQKARICNDVNDCGTTSNKPIDVQICKSEEYYLRIGDSINIDNKTVKLIDVGSGGSITIDVNDMQKIINLYGIKTINGVDVYNAKTFYANNRDERAAIIHAKKSIISEPTNQSDIYNLNLKIGETIKFLNGRYNIILKEVLKDGGIILEVNKENFRLSIGQNVTMDILVIVLLNSSYEKKIAQLKISVDNRDFPEYYILFIEHFESTPTNPKVGESVLIYFEDRVSTDKKTFEFPKKIKISIYYNDLLDDFLNDDFNNEELIKEIYFPCSPYPEVTSDSCLIEFNYQFLKEGVYKFLIQNFDENNKELETDFQEQYVFVINEDKIKTHKFPIGLWTYAGGGNLNIVHLNQFNQIKDLSIDTIVDGHLYDLKFNKELLFLAQKNGINVMFADNELAYFSYNLDDDSEKERAILYLKELIKNIELEYKGFNSIYRYYLDDEPENELQINFVGDAINELNNINTPRKGTTTLYGNLNLIDYYYKTVNSKEVIVDHYPLFSDTPKEGLELQTRFDELTSILNHLNKLSKVYNKPFWFFVQAHQWGLEKMDFYVRDPTPKEIRAMTYLALSYGAKGIFYFYYWSDPDVGSRGLVEENLQPNEKYYEVRKINQELRKIRDILIDLDNINTCNSKTLGINGNNLINNNWQFEDNGWSYTHSLNQNNEVNVYFNGNYLKSLKNREDIWFDFWYDTNISTVLDKYILIDYEIIKNSNNLKLYFNPAREDGSLKDIFLESSLGKHKFIINLKNLRGSSESDIINTVAFFITNFDKGGGDLEVKINSIKDYKCELPYVLEATGNIEIGNFIHKNGDKYIILVNRDTNNDVRTKIKLNDNLGRVYIYDVLTKEEIYNEKNNLYTFYYNLGPGDGKLIKIIKDLN